MCTFPDMGASLKLRDQYFSKNICRYTCITGWCFLFSNSGKSRRISVREYLVCIHVHGGKPFLMCKSPLSHQMTKRALGLLFRVRNKRLRLINSYPQTASKNARPNGVKSKVLMRTRNKLDRRETPHVCIAYWNNKWHITNYVYGTWLQRFDVYIGLSCFSHECQFCV